MKYAIATLTSLGFLLPIVSGDILPDCPFLFHFDSNQMGTCTVDEKEILWGAAGMAYTFAAGIASDNFVQNNTEFVIDFTMANSPVDPDAIDVENALALKLSGSLLWVEYDEYFLGGHPRPGGKQAKGKIDNYHANNPHNQECSRRHLKEENVLPWLVETPRRKLGTCSSCRCCEKHDCAYGYVGACGCTCDCDNCSRRRELRSNKQKKSIRKLMSLQNNNICPINPITLSMQFTDLVNNYYSGSLACLQGVNYKLYLGDKVYYIVVDATSGQQIQIEFLYDWV